VRRKKLRGDKEEKEEARGKREIERKENQFFIILFHQSLSPLEYKSHLDSQLNPRTTPIY